MTSQSQANGPDPQVLGVAADANLGAWESTQVIGIRRPPFPEVITIVLGIVLAVVGIWLTDVTDESAYIALFLVGVIGALTGIAMLIRYFILHSGGGIAFHFFAEGCIRAVRGTFSVFPWATSRVVGESIRYSSHGVGATHNRWTLSNEQAVAMLDVKALGRQADTIGQLLAERCRG